MNLGVMEGLLIGVIPYLPGDAVKIALDGDPWTCPEKESALTFGPAHPLFLSLYRIMSPVFLKSSIP